MESAARYSSASVAPQMVRDLSPLGRRVKSTSPAPSPSKRRHRRSYTISAPFNFRTVEKATPGFPSRRTDTSNDDEAAKENQPPLPTEPTSRSLTVNDTYINTLAKRDGKPPPRVFHTTSIVNDRFLDLPPLPENWDIQHDRAICVLDSRNYSYTATVNKLRRVFPELKGTITPLMIDKRLRILDQRLDVDYWRIGLGLTKKSRMLQPANSSSNLNINSRDNTMVLSTEPTPKAKRAKCWLSSLSPKSPLSIQSFKPMSSRFGSEFRTYIDRF